MLNPIKPHLHQKLLHQRFLDIRNYRLLIAIALLTSSSILRILPVFAVTPPGVIENQATGSYIDPSNNTEQNVESNTVKVTVAEVAGITVTGIGTEEAPQGVSDSGPDQGNNEINPEDIIYFKYKITNVGNDPTQFFIPSAPSNIANGILKGSIQIIEYDPDGSGPNAPTDLSSSPKSIPNGGISTGDANALGLPNGSIPPNGTVTIRVPIKINAGLNDGDKVKVVMGDTPPNDNPPSTQNQVYSPGSNDIYTQDNKDTDNISGEAAGNPINGDATNHRQEASATQDVTVIAQPNYEVSPFAGKVIINEVLYNETGNSAATNDEFIEIYNASNSPVDLSGWKLMDGNIIANNTDNNDSITGSSSPYEFPNGTTLEPGEYAVIWIGDNTNTPDRKATGAKFQAWLGNAPRLNNIGDDMWLYDRDTKIVDYVAYGSGTAINTPPPSSLKLWDSTHQTALAGANTGQSISLTKNGLDGNTSACWEPTTSGNAKTQGCTNYLPTIDSDDTQSRVSSAGGNNNGTPNILLVKRITAINGQTTNPNDNTTPLNTVVDDTDSPRQEDDNHPNWASDYLKGAINGGSVKPNDELEYTIYYLSAGSTPAKSVLFCDRVPENVTFIANSFNNQAQATGGLQSADRGILWLKDGKTESLTNIQDGDFAQYFPPNTEPSTVYPNIKCDGVNTNGAVVVNLQDLPDATGSGTPNTSYGLIRFRGRIK